MQFIDIHGHYAWKIDSHIQTRESAKRVLEIASKQDIIAVVASPRMICGREKLQDIYDRRKRIEELKLLAQQYAIHVYEGSELMLNDHLESNLKNQLIVPIEKTRYVLCTFDMVSTPYTRTDMLHYLRLIMRAGYKPILTRAESYIHQKQDLSFLEKLHNEGVGLQVNSSSLLGGQGEQIRTLAYNLLSSGMIHIIATDTHSYEGFSVPNMKDTFQYLSKSFDYKALKRLMYDNPLHIISNESLETIEARKKGLFERIKMRY